VATPIEDRLALDVSIRPEGEDGVIALFRMIASGEHSGLEHGQIVYLAYYNDQEQALEAARQAA
jgi:hypothetical protein